MFGLAGTHRSGKTTTAKHVAQRLGLDFHDGSFGKLAARLGYNSVEAMTPEARIEMQEKCLALHLADLQALPRPCITDRTPLDFIAYAVAEIGMHSGVSENVSRRVDPYVENCLRVTKGHYGGVALLKPLPVYKNEEGKPSSCIGYQTHVQLLIEGALFRLRGEMSIGIVSGFDLESRVQQVSGLFGDTLVEYEGERAARLVH